MGFGALGLFYFLVRDFFTKQYFYSVTNANFKASMITGALVAFIVVDRPAGGYWYRSAALGLFLCKYII